MGGVDGLPGSGQKEYNCSGVAAWTPRASPPITVSGDDGLYWVDWAAVALLLLLSLRGYQRGLIDQLSTFVAVGLGIVGGLYLHEAALPLLPAIPQPEIQLAASFALVFGGIAISVRLLGRLLRAAIHAFFLGGLDRLLGGVFGLLVGLQVLLIAMLLVSRYLPEGGQYLQASRSGPMLMDLLERLRPMLPEHFAAALERYGDLLAP